MFTTKQKPTAAKSQKTGNSFIQAATKKSLETVSGNGAKKYASTNVPLVDQLGVTGKYKQPRDFKTIVQDFQTLWADNPLNAVKFNLFLRTIPRKVNLPDGSTTAEPQKGGELKHEAIMRMIWLAVDNPRAFWNNILLFVSVGSWHDVFTMLNYDLTYNGWAGRKLDWDKFGDLILAGLKNKNTSELIKKYLPQIKANSACTTIEAQSNNAIAKWLCSLLFGAKNGDWSKYKLYRKLKTSGTAHEWQQLISKKKFNEIDFGKIHGRALSILVRGKFLKNQGLSDKYSKWIAKPETQVKYTGFVHELFEGMGTNIAAIDKNRRETINKQFATLVEKGGEKKGVKFLVCRDISGSMGSPCTGTRSSCYDVAKSLALYFSEFLQGEFANSYVEFHSVAKLVQWKGNTPIEKWCNDRSSYVGGTNFQAVIDIFVNAKREGVNECEFPTGILAVSDGEYNPAQLGKTNVESALDKLTKAGFSKEYVKNFTIILWNLQSGYYGKGTGEKFETVGGVPNVYYFGGFSPSIVSFLTDNIKTAEELALNALNQEILNMVEI